MYNLSRFDQKATAHTSSVCAQQRAQNLFCLGSKRILELCVGPSLKALEEAYRPLGMEVWGNDIDPQWQHYYPQGKWIIGDAQKVDTNKFDTIVVAPPLSKGCSGKREDSLSIDQVIPSYYSFLNTKAKILVFVLPGRSRASKLDKKEFYRLLSILKTSFEVCPLVDKVTKYWDVYIY